MGNFYDDDDREGEDPVIRTQVELTLQNLLQKQLSTFVRLERVEFEGVTQSMLCIGHGFSGVGTLAEFREDELLQKKEYNYTEFMNSLSPSPGFSKDGNKRKRRNCLQEAIIKQGWTLSFTKALHVRNVFVERLTRSAPVQLQKYFPIWLLKQQFSMQTLLDFSHQLAHHLCGYTSGVSCRLEWQLQIYHWS